MSNTFGGFGSWVHRIFQIFYLACDLNYVFHLVCVIDEVMALSKCFFAEGALGTVALVRVHWRVHRPEDENNIIYKYCITKF